MPEPKQGYLMTAAQPPVEMPPAALDGYLPQPAKERPVRVVYSASGRPTAALLRDFGIVLDATLYWIECDYNAEAYYLCGIINSDALYAAVEPLMHKGQFGPRGMHKAIWHLPIPEFDAADPLHAEIAAGGAACIRAASLLSARREVRLWMQDAPDAHRVEELVSQLLVAEED